MISTAWILSTVLVLLSLAIDVNGRSTSPWLSTTTTTTGSSFFSQRRPNTSSKHNFHTINTAQILLRGGSAAADATRQATAHNFDTNTAAATATTSTATATATTLTTPSIHAEYIHQTTGGSILPKSSSNVNTANAANTTNTKEASATSSSTAAAAAAIVSSSTEKSKPIVVVVDKSTKKIIKQQNKEIKKKDKEIKKLHKQIAKKLKNRNATNKRRKFMHFAWGILFASLNHFIPRTTFIPIMASLTSFTLFMELMRYRDGYQWINTSFYYLFGKSLRKSEMDGKFTGSLYYFAGVTATSYLYPKSCATLGIIQLAIADPTASYFGRATRHVYWSRINKGFAGGLGRNKGILGFLGGAIACVPLNYRILTLACRAAAKVTTTMSISNPTIFIASLVLGLAGAFADLIVPTPALTLPKTICGKSVPPFHLDDNFIVPVLSGYACTQIFKYILGVPTMIIPLSKYLIV